jgi:hypothetical protein
VLFVVNLRRRDKVDSLSVHGDKVLIWKLQTLICTGFIEKDSN